MKYLYNNFICEVSAEAPEFTTIEEFKEMKSKVCEVSAEAPEFTTIEEFKEMKCFRAKGQRLAAVELIMGLGVVLN
ncbi:unnamed protein product [Oppiella nova]|uniref:Uncharacterized protein n=1 Tax=Oppiella nova TaxID=334625 RepID=A0A7R9LBY3_9ACAR|nr:unnamed protein product [Oppiella nova]CAG2162032.1 unnamed protein product [Oppiella nova]